MAMPASLQRIQSRAKTKLTEIGRGPTNVGRTERWVSTIGGGMLAAYGLTRGLAHDRRHLGGGLAAAAAGGVLLYRGVTGRCPAYEAMGVSTAGAEGMAVSIHETVTIERSPRELYDFWRDLENLPRFMDHLELVRRLDERRSLWIAKVPEGMGSLSWQAEITEDRPGELLAWHSLPDADIETAGTVRFEEAPGQRGTEVHVTIGYQPPGGAVGTVAARLLNPLFSQVIREDVRRFKHLMEAGEIPTVEGQAAGR